MGWRRADNGRPSFSLSDQVPIYLSGFLFHPPQEGSAVERGPNGGGEMTAARLQQGRMGGGWEGSGWLPGGDAAYPLVLFGPLLY